MRSIIGWWKEGKSAADRALDEVSLALAGGKRHQEEEIDIELDLFPPQQ